MGDRVEPYLIVGLGVEALLIVVLLLALVWGQPASYASTLEHVNAQATETTWLRATVSSLPRPTSSLCNYGTTYRPCYP